MAIESAADFVRTTRGIIAEGGFVRQELDGTVYWTSDVIPSVARDLGGGGPTHMPAAPPAQVPPYARDDKPLLVLIHGANDQAGTWFTIAGRLIDRYRVIIPDLPGHGESAPRSGPIPISLILERLETILANKRDLTLLGNSLGGWLAILLALRHPDRVRRLILEASGGLARPLSVPLVARTREEAIPILRAVHGPAYQAPEWVVEALMQRAVDSPMLRLTEVLEHNIEPRLGELNIPATLIWGADDGVLPLSYAEALQQAIPGAELQVIEGAAHIPHLQQPERFLQCLTAIS